MSRHQIQAGLRQIANQAMAGLKFIKLGQITSTDPASHAIKALLQPEGVETGWIPFGCVVFGPGAGVFALPVKDAQVAIGHEQGDIEAGVAHHSLCDDNFTPPEGFMPGEWWVVLPGGNLLKVTSDGKVTVTDGHGASITLNGDGTLNSAGAWTHTGTFHATDNITSDKTVTGTTDVVGGGKSLKGHTHNVEHVQGGGSTLPTDPPT